jgi:hypothetical protein
VTVRPRLHFAPTELNPIFVGPIIDKHLVPTGLSLFQQLFGFHRQSQPSNGAHKARMTSRAPKHPPGKLVRKLAIGIVLIGQVDELHKVFPVHLH